MEGTYRYCMLHSEQGQSVMVLMARVVLQLNGQRLSQRESMIKRHQSISISGVDRALHQHHRGSLRCVSASAVSGNPPTVHACACKASTRSIVYVCGMRHAR